MIDGVDTMSRLCLLCATMHHHLIMFHFDAKKGNNTGTLQEKIEHCLYINDLRGNIRGLTMRYATQELVSGYVTMSHGNAWWCMGRGAVVYGARRGANQELVSKKNFFETKKSPAGAGQCRGVLLVKVKFKLAIGIGFIIGIIGFNFDHKLNYSFPTVVVVAVTLKIILNFGLPF